MRSIRLSMVDIPFTVHQSNRNGRHELSPQFSSWSSPESTVMVWSIPSINHNDPINLNFISARRVGEIKTFDKNFFLDPHLIIKVTPPGLWEAIRNKRAQYTVGTK